MVRRSWHSAFVQAIQHELEDYRESLTFESEHQLTTEPLRIDVLIIKKEKDVVIKKNIARIFRQFNVVEYKGPGDSVTIEAYHKTQCYARLYVALNKLDINDVSVTIAATRLPKKLLTFLNGQYTVVHIMPGICTVVGDACPTQIIVSEQLPEKDNLWLNSLRSGLTADRLERLALSSGQNVPMDAYFQVIGEANIKAMEDLHMRKKKGVILSEKLDAYFRERFAPDIAQSEARGITIGEARGITIGEARGKAGTVLTVLRAKFKKIPRSVESAIRHTTDPTALDSWAARAVTCQSLDEFAEALK